MVSTFEAKWSPDLELQNPGLFTSFGRHERIGQCSCEIWSLVLKTELNLDEILRAKRSVSGRQRIERIHGTGTARTFQVKSDTLNDSWQETTNETGP
jgi:hypothetical protein